MKNQKCIIVLGMHRSGTSALAGVLELLGVNMGVRLCEARSDNPKGYFENEKINHFNECRLLPYLKSSWHDVFPLRKGWQDDTGLESFYREAEDILASDYSLSSIFGMKEPRLCVLLPFWEKVLRKLEIKTCYILPLRNPLEVAFSLARRDNFSIGKSLLLWSRHLFSAEFYSRRNPRVFVAYDDLLGRTEYTVNRIQKLLHISFPHSYESARKQIEQFLEKDLRHHRLDFDNLDPVLPDFIIRAVRELSGLAKSEDSHEGAADSAFDALREEYDRYSELFYNTDLRKEQEELRSELTRQDTVIREFEDRSRRFATLYVDEGEGFSEKVSLRIPNPEDTKTLTFDLSRYPIIRGLRFDPLDQSVLIDIQRAVIYWDDKSAELKIAHSNAAFSENNLDFFVGSDPWIIFECPKIVSDRITLKIIMRYVSTGKEALEGAFHVQGEKYAKELRDLKSLLSEKETEIFSTRAELGKKETEISNAIRLLEEKEGEIAAGRENASSLLQQLSEMKTATLLKEEEISRQQKLIHTYQEELSVLNGTLHGLLQSKSWRLTSPLRSIGNILRSLK